MIKLFVILVLICIVGYMSYGDDVLIATEVYKYEQYSEPCIDEFEKG